MAINLSKRFSEAHFDDWEDSSLFYEMLKNSSQQFRDEIYDIYFGKIFRYNYQGREIYENGEKNHNVVYGNVMGVEASDEQVNNLFKIQKEFGIEISLTINQLNVPVEIFYSKNDHVMKAFLDWLQEFYERGLRSCTLANNHVMRSGILQKRFPQMKWKNTVNQQVSNAQQVLDYLYLGYNIIQLDRSLNRNMAELKRIKEVVEKYKNEHPEKPVKTCMLVAEDCMPSCPFKREHDDLQMYYKKVNYWDSNLGAQTCQVWREVFGERTLPRTGTNCFWVSVDTFNEYAELVDIFKYSGRLTVKAEPNAIQFGWFTGKHAVSSFAEIIENQLEPLCSWFLGFGKLSLFKTDIGIVREDLSNSYWLSEQGKKLEQRLKNCRNQCYQCHQCERTFSLPDINSMVEI